MDDVHAGSAPETKWRIQVEMNLDELKNMWTTLGDKDPMWAILNDPTCKQDAWTADDFFQTGRDHIKHVLQKALPQGHGKALDFGCGIGRLTQALAEHFESVDGVDISNSMIENAKKLNRFPDRVVYHLNQQNNLSIFPSNQYDFVCSVIVLQHMPAVLQRNYIGEFIRVLKPGGVVFFQSNHTSGWRKLVPDWAVEFYRKIKYKGGALPYIPHYGIPVKDVGEIVKRAGGTIVKHESAPYTSRPNRWRSDDFCVKKVG
jgi:ubiquinone/menaquinone biosynthesis C-methylase UbiE